VHTFVRSREQRHAQRVAVVSVQSFLAVADANVITVVAAAAAAATAAAAAAAARVIDVITATAIAA
jgi:hypothetical protein